MGGGETHGFLEDLEGSPPLLGERLNQKIGQRGGQPLAPFLQNLVQTGNDLLAEATLHMNGIDVDESLQEPTGGIRENVAPVIGHSTKR